MLLLISPINREEALESIEGGADIVDVKNPKEGSLGANFPWVIKEIRELTPEDKLVSWPSYNQSIPSPDYCLL